MSHADNIDQRYLVQRKEMGQWQTVMSAWTKAVARLRMVIFKANEQGITFRVWDNRDETEV